MRNLTYNLEKYYSTDKREALGLIVTILMIAFMFSFRQWGEDSFDMSVGLGNLIAAIFITAIAVITHVTAQKVVAIKRGYIPRYNLFIYGLIGGVILTFLTRGFLYFLPVGAISIKHLNKLRLGRFRYGLNFSDLSRISLAGPLANIFLALIASFLPTSPLVEAFVRINILLAVFSMFPIPPMNGANIIFQSRVIYVISTAFIIAMGLLIQFANPIITLLGALVLAGAAGIYFIFGVENK